MSSRWLAPYSWEFITAQNAALCAAKNAKHGPTSDGHEAARKLWSDRFAAKLTLAEAVELCRKCHELAPFCFYNGNTFAAVVRDVIHQLPMVAVEKSAARSLAGHIVAGVASREEVEEFQRFCKKHGY